MKNTSENMWEDELARVKITIEVEEITDGGEPKWDKVLTQAKHCINGLGYDVELGLGEQDG